MTPAEFNTLITIGGWGVFAIYFLYNKVWPLVADKIIPEHLRSREVRQSAREAELLADKKFRQEMERGQLEAQKMVATAVQDLALSHAKTNERITTLMANQAMILNRQDATFSVLTDALGEIRMYNENFGRRSTDKNNMEGIND